MGLDRLESPVDCLPGLILDKLGVGGNAHFLAENRVEDVEGALPSVGVMEVQILVDDRPASEITRWVPVPHSAGVLAAEVPDDGVALGQVEPVLAVDDGGHLAHGVDFLELGGLHFELGDPDLVHLGGDLVEQAEGPDCP